MKYRILFTTLGICAASLIPVANAVTIVGVGNGALLGGDLTDPENDGVDDDTVTGQNFDATFFATSSATFSGNGGAFQVFSNSLTALSGSGNGHKFCCSGAGSGFVIGATLAAPVVLTHFTLSSSNDSPGRDPDVYQFQGSNDTTNGFDGTWIDIYAHSDDGGLSPSGTATQHRLFDGNTQWTARNQVLRFDGAGTDFATPAAYSSFRINMESASGWFGTGNVGDPNDALALAEIEIFGTPVPEPSAFAFISLAGLGLILRRRR